MKKIIPKLYLVCIAVGLLIVIAANIGSKNIYKGKMWEATKEPVLPVETIQKSDSVRQFVFDVADFKQGRNCLFFRTAHMDIEAYADEVSQAHQIYGFFGNQSMFGRTSGSQYHFIEIPPMAKKVIVNVDAAYEKFYSLQLEFYQTDGIWAFKNTIQKSLPEALISCFLVVLGILLISYWLMAGRKIDTKNTALYFGCFATLLGAWTFNETGLAVLIIRNRTAASLTGFVLLFSMLQPMILFTGTYLQVKDTKNRNICCLLITLTMFVCMGLHLSGLVEMREIAIVAHLQILLVLIYIIYAFVSYIKRYGIDRKIVVNIVGVAILAAASFMDVYIYYIDNIVNDMLGRFGMLMYIVILAVEVLSEFLRQIEENRKYTYYKELAVTDMLTGVRNRNAYERWEKEETDWKDMAIVTFDLNNLKKCNDTKGHLAGDKYIVEASNIIRSVFEKVGICYRIGGDEFVVVIHRALRLNMDKYIRQLRKREQEYNQQDGEIKMQIACGYATCKSEEDTIERIRRRADSAMYKNKQELKQQERIAES